MDTNDESSTSSTPPFTLTDTPSFDDGSSEGKEDQQIDLLVVTKEIQDSKDGKQMIHPDEVTKDSSRVITPGFQP